MNEASVSTGIVLPILDGLSWPTFNVETVYPEYPVPGGRVDWALCDQRGKPLVFIEVKRVGENEGADRQLFQYAFHGGVPLAILTTGQEWHFYLPLEQGDYGERRLYMLDIVERSVEESVERLHRYLDYNRVRSGEAIEAAKNDYQDVAKEREIRAVLPEAWRKLVDEQDELLLELVADKVESICGYKPKPDVIALFLADQVSGGSAPTVTHSAHVYRRGGNPTHKAAAANRRGGVGFVFRGRWHAARSGRDVVIQILQQIAAEDPSFLQRFAALPKHGNKTRYIARTPEELNPSRPDLTSKDSREIAPGWWVYLVLNGATMTRIVQLACGVAGLRYGDDVQIALV